MGPVFLLIMMKKIILSAFTAIMLISCSRSGLAPVAKYYLPARLNEAMTEYMETVGEPEVDNLKVIYDCDSLCIITSSVLGSERFPFRLSRCNSIHCQQGHFQQW